MGATRRSASTTQFFEVKHFCLWRQIKNEVAGCDAVEVTNPKNGDVSTKYGFMHDSLSGRAVKLEWYDTGSKHTTRYIGFKLTLVDQGERFVLDLPYKSRSLQRLMMAARNIDWEKEIRFVVFKGKNRRTGAEETVFLIQQDSAWVKPFYTKDDPKGLPPAVHYAEAGEWDFKAQLSYLAREFKDIIAPQIEAVARDLQAQTTSSVEDAITGGHQEETGPVSAPRGWQGEPAPHAPIDDDDIPF